MAIVTRGFRLSVVLIDVGGNQAVRNFELKATNYADAVTAAGVIVPALDAVTDATIKGYSVSEQYLQESLILPAAGVQVENMARIVIGIDDEPLKRWTTDIPAPVAAMFVAASGPGNNTVNVSYADLVTYMALFAAAGPAYVSDGESVEPPILSGKRVHRASNRG